MNMEELTREGIPLSFHGSFHWADRLMIEVYPMKVDDESIQVVKIRFYAKDKRFQDGEITAFTNHKFVKIHSKLEKNLTTITIERKEKSGGRKKE